MTEIKSDQKANANTEIYTDFPLVRTSPVGRTLASSWIHYWEILQVFIRSPCNFYRRELWYEELDQLQLWRVESSIKHLISIALKLLDRTVLANRLSEIVFQNHPILLQMTYVFEKHHFYKKLLKDFSKS